MKSLLPSFLCLLSIGVEAKAGITVVPGSSESSSSVLLDWKAEGEFSEEITGTLAVPPGCNQITALVESWEETPKVEALSPPTPPHFGVPALFRDIALATFTWTPTQIRNGKTLYLTRARIHVFFQPSKAPEPGRLRSFAGSALDPTEKILAHWLVNYAQSRSFRTAKPSSTPRASGATATLPAQRLVVYTRRDAIEVITYAQLRGAGIPVSKLDPRRLQMFRKGKEIPIFVQGEENGRFESGEYLEFIGSKALGIGAALSPYTTETAYYLIWDVAPGLRSPAIPAGLKNAQSPLVTSFPVNTRIEEDNEILRIGSTAVEDISDLGGKVDEETLSDFWFWKRQGFERDATDIPFALLYSPMQNTGIGTHPQKGQIQIQLKGLTNDVKADPDHHLSFLLNGVDISLANGLPQHAIWEGQNSYTWVSPPLPDNALHAGKNVLTMVRVKDLRNSDGKLVENQDTYLNFLQINFPSSFKAVGNLLRFSNASAALGWNRYQIEGLDNPEVSLWDIRGRKLVGFPVTKKGASYQAEFEDSLIATTEYLLSTTATRESPRLQLDTLPDWLQPQAGADLIIITHRDLLGSGLDSLVAARKAQGLRVKVIDILHLYQTFGEGTTDPEAIRRFAKWAFENWPRPAPIYLLLIGETSTWYDKKVGAWQQNLVPTHLVNIRGWGVAAADDYFGQVAGEDAIADLIVGRIPVGSKSDLSNVIRKILVQEKRPPGAWHNKSQIIGGYEANFSLGQNLLQSLAARSDRPPTRLDLYPGSTYYRPLSGRSDFYRQMDSGFAFVGFFGHGGGSVWSDAGILTLDALDKDSLKGNYSIPLVSSITCLTGYFEDVAGRSLGEELLRRPRNGASGFYGASGYISNVAGSLLASELLRAALNPNATTLGSVMHQAETQMLLKTGTNFIPILSEFNLLGDPSMPYGFAPRSGALALTPKTLGNKRSLEVSVPTLAVQAGDALVSLLIGDSVAANALVPFTAGTLRHTFQLPDTLPGFQSGKVVAHVWNTSRSDVYASEFSGLDWMIDSLRLEPAHAQPGDSLRVHFILRHNQQVKTASGILFYSVTGDQPGDFPTGNEVPLISTGGIGYATSRSFLLPFPTDPNTPPLYQLNVAMRMNLQDSLGNNLASPNSRIFSFPLPPLARLGLTTTCFRLPLQDSLGVWVRFRNQGLGQNGKAQIVLTYQPSGVGMWSDSVPVPKPLKYGQTDSVFIRLPDSALGIKLNASILTENPNELQPRENSRDSLFNLWTQVLVNSSDSLKPWVDGPTFRLASGSNARRIFVGSIDSVGLDAFITPIDSLPATRRGYWVASREPVAKSILIVAPPQWILTNSPTLNQGGRWHFSEKPVKPWLQLDSGSSRATVTLYKSGFYGFFQNADHFPPRIQFLSRGQSLLQDDYIPRNTSIQVLLEDPSGIDMTYRKPLILVGSGKLDSASLVLESPEGIPSLARLQFQPPQINRDSISVEAYDAAGNLANQKLIFRVGEKFSIRNLGSYPNPFADTAIFVYSLTDYCEEVTLKIYSRSGRVVRTLYEHKAVGYREVLWDGRTDQGRLIANGLYFLKVTAQSGSRESSAIFKLFKKRY